jgi:hypothetical protein
MPNETSPVPRPSKVSEENSKAIPVSAKDEAEEKKRRAKRIANICLSPELNAARLTCIFGPRSLDVMEAADKLKEYTRAANDGDLSQAEAMLINQAHALEAMFVNLAERAQISDHLPMMGLALKAQAQCRATLQTLTEVKFPNSATFIRQANIAHQQQVNNGTAPPHDPRVHPREAELPSSKELGEPRAGARETENAPDKLSGGNNELLPDTGTPGAAVDSDPAMATVGTFDRAKVRRR